MNFEEYDRSLQKWDHKGGVAIPDTIAALGLAGEAGEVVDLIKKREWHGKTVSPAELALELGDVLWYLRTLARSVGMSLGEIAQANVDKLEHRYPNGFVEGGGNR